MLQYLDMDKIFLVLLLSIGITGLLAIPFINLLYKLKFQRQREFVQKDLKSAHLIDQLHDWKVGTPNAGGLLVIFVATLLGLVIYQFTSFKFNWTIGILAFTLIMFGLLGFYDDLRKFLEQPDTGVWGLRAWQKLAVQLVFGLTIGWMLYAQMGMDAIRLPFDYELVLGWWYVPFAALVVATMSNAFNITDGIDGLSSGLLLIALSAFMFLAVTFATADVVVFIAVLMGSLLSFLYFNIYPARMWMGDTGSLAFGAALAVIALLSHNVFVLPIIGGMFVVELCSSIIQMVSLRYRGKKVFLIAPIHHHFEALGWNETKVTMRFWLFGVVFAFVGLWVALL
jgi:phospho-N-acetylmuramoyl-pentapeptide-transferase